MQTRTQLRTSNPLLVPIVLLVITGLFNALSFFIPLILLTTGHFDGIRRPIPVIVIVLVLAVVSLVAAWGLGKRQRWARTAGLISTLLLLLLAIVGIIIPVTGGELDLGPIIDIPLTVVLLVFLFRPTVKQALA
jgi:peptidoglycan/LPS O-acetylase OafA/YrhL